MLTSWDISLIIIITFVIVIVVIIVILTTMSVPVLTYYYQYPTDQTVAQGTFGDEKVVSSIRLMTLYSDKNLTHKVGYFNTMTAYVTFPLDNQLLLVKDINVSLENGNNFVLKGWMDYTSSPPAKPTSYTFEKSLIISSNDVAYIGKNFNAYHVEGTTYRLQIGL
jgi:hypothetical protein